MRGSVTPGRLPSKTPGRFWLGEALQFLLFEGGLPEAQDACVGAFSGPQGLCRGRGGFSFGDDAWVERWKSETALAGAKNRPSDPAALATVVEKDICARQVLESGTGPVPASDCRGAIAVGFGGSLRRPANGRFGESDEVSLADHDEFLQGGGCYVMGFSLPQKMLLDAGATSVVEQWASCRGGLEDDT